MTESAVKAPVSVADTCEVCGASLRAGDTRCWLCRAIAERGTVPINRPRAAPIMRAGGFSLASLMMFVTLISVVFGLSTIVPGVGIPLGVLLLVAWGRTVSVSRRLADRGESLTSSQQIQMYFSSLGFVVALLVMVTVAVGIAAGSICFGLVSVAGGFGHGSAGQIALGLACVAALVAAVGLIRWAAKLNDYQWRRTTGEKRETPKDKERR